DNLAEIQKYVASWPSSLGSELSLYFHYCGNGKDIPREGKNPLTGDQNFFENNKRVSCELADGSIRTRDDGMHNWFFWRPELAEFLRSVSQVWCSTPASKGGTIYGILFRVVAKPGKYQELCDFLNWDAEVARAKEPGTLRFEFYRDGSKDA